jgi:hypothetical protein
MTLHLLLTTLVLLGTGIVLITAHALYCTFQETRYYNRSRTAFAAQNLKAAISFALKAEQYWTINVTNGSPSAKSRSLIRLRQIISVVSDCEKSLGDDLCTGGVMHAVDSCLEFYQNRSNFRFDGRMMRSAESHECLKLLAALKSERLNFREAAGKWSRRKKVTSTESRANR